MAEGIVCYFAFAFTNSITLLRVEIRMSFWNTQWLLSSMAWSWSSIAEQNWIFKSAHGSAVW